MERSSATFFSNCTHLQGVNIESKAYKKLAFWSEKMWKSFHELFDVIIMQIIQDVYYFYFYLIIGDLTPKTPVDT